MQPNFDGLVRQVTPPPALVVVWVALWGVAWLGGMAGSERGTQHEPWSGVQRVPQRVSQCEPQRGT
jgi:hypothetical protein